MEDQGNQSIGMDQEDLSEAIQLALRLDAETVDSVLDFEMAFLVERGLAGDEAMMANVVPMSISVDIKDIIYYIVAKTGFTPVLVSKILDAEEVCLEQQHSNEE